MDSTLSGIVMVFKEPQFWKAWLPIFSNVEGSFTSSTLLHSRKAQAGRLVMPSGTSMRFRAVQPAKMAPCPLR